jgi:hypothetical protein
MAFKGIIPIGSTVKATFSANFTNSGSALLLISFAPLSGPARAATQPIAAGGRDSVQIAAPETGFLRVFVDVTDDDDGGVLETEVNGQARDNDRITGDDTWLYTVENL